MILVENRVMINLRKIRFLPQRQIFGIDVTEEGNKPEKTKIDTFKDLVPPLLFYDWRKLTGSFGFYRNWLP